MSVFRVGVFGFCILDNKFDVLPPLFPPIQKLWCYAKHYMPKLDWFYFIQDRHMYAPLVQLKLWLVIHLLCIAHFPATQLSSYDGRNQARNLYQVKLIDIYVLCTHYRLCIQINWLNAFACIYITTGTKYELSSIQSGGALKIHQIDSGQDSGVYTCRVGRAGEEARRDIELTVNSKLRPFFSHLSVNLCGLVCENSLTSWNGFFYHSISGPPVIEPFAFPKNLQDGGRAQVTCAVSSGDMPIAFSWKKDGHQIPSSLQVIQTLEFLTNHLTFERHLNVLASND